MRKWTLLCGAVIAVGFLATQASAQESIKQEPIPLPKTVIQSSQPVVVQPTGLFGRMRARRGIVTTVNQPIVQAQAVDATGKVVQAQDTQPGVQPGTMPAQTQAPMQVMPERRMGLLARLRDRRGF
jgi:hypothetical protein